MSLIHFRNRVYFRAFNSKYTLIVDSLGKTVVPKEYAHNDLYPEELDLHDDDQLMYFMLYEKKNGVLFALIRN